MIHKSYLIEQDMRKLEKNISLFYGENLGLIDDFKQIIKKLYKNSTIIRLNEEEIIKKKILFYLEK